MSAASTERAKRRALIIQTISIERKVAYIGWQHTRLRLHLGVRTLDTARRWLKNPLAMVVAGALAYGVGPQRVSTALRWVSTLWPLLRDTVYPQPINPPASPPHDH